MLYLFKRLACLAALACPITSCGPSNSSGEGEGDSLAMDSLLVDSVLAPPPKVKGELPLLSLAQSGVEFDETLLHSLDRVDDYLAFEDKASLNLGIYAADALYLALFDKTQEYMLYSSGCQRMAKELDVRDGFGMEMAQRLDLNVGNPDSVCSILNESILKARRSLEEDGQSRIAALIAFGGFIEDLHLLCASFRNIPNDDSQKQDTQLKALVPALREIRKQKESIKTLREQLAALGNDEAAKVLKEKLTNIESALNNVKTNSALPNDGLKANTLNDLIPLVEETREYIIK